MNKDRTKGMVVAYVDARMVMDRLDEAVGPAGWTDEYRILSDRETKTEAGPIRTLEVECSLTLFLEDTGITKRDVGEGDTLKAAYSDAFKRAAVKFGIGRYLYSLPKLWADLNEYKQIKDPEALKARLLGNQQPKPVQPTPQPQAKPQAQAKPTAQPAPNKPSDRQANAIRALAAKELGVGVKDLPTEDLNDFLGAALGRDASLDTISAEDASKVIEWFQDFAKENQANASRS
jgi:hypothetical protein